ncbi:MAG: PAS domain S-box protein [Pseudomonadota bacterium]
MVKKPTYEELVQRLKDLERISEEGTRSAEALRKSEIRYQQLFESVPVGLYRTTPGGEILDGNPALVEILGYPDLETLMEVNTKGIVNPEYHRQVQTLLEREGITHDFELRVRRHDGTFIWVRDTARAVRDADGSVLYYEGSLEDITKRKQAEEKIKASEAKYRELFNNISSGVAIYEAKDNGNDFIFKDFNRAGERIENSKKDDLIGKSVVEMFPGVKEFGLFNIFKRVWETGKPEHYPISLYKDQRIVGWRENYVYKLPSGEIVAVYDDVTDRKKGEAQIIRQSKVFRETLTSESEKDVAETCLAVAEELTGSEFGFIGELNPGGLFDTIAISNPGWDTCKMPYSDAVVMTKDMEIRGIWGSVIEKERSLIVNNPASHPDRVGTPEGHPPIISFLGVPLKKSGKTIGMIGLANKESGYDLDDQQSIEILSIAFVEALNRKQAEEKLKESEERYRVLVEGSTDAILMMDRERNIVHCNKAFLDLFGYGKGEVEGKSIRIIHKSDKSFHSFGAAAYPIDEKVGYFRTEWEFMRKDGTIFPVETVTTQMRSLDGAIKSYIAVIRDITERKRMETQLQHTQKMEAVGTLAGGMAHEFNNLMTAVLSYSSFLLTDLGEDDPMRKDVEEIKSAGKRASSLVKHLLAFSRKQVLQPKPLDINSVLTDKEEMLGHLIGEDVELEMVLEQDLDKVKADQSQVEQVILNLTINARDAMPLGGKLTIETANVEIDEFYVSTHGDELKPGPYVMLAMSDTGMGMDKETQSQIFEPFFTTKDMGEGTGLGLSAVYGIVKQSGGDIRVYSEPEKGTIFKIYLPRMEQDVEAVQAGDSMTGQLGGSETVLLVEDNDLVRKVSRRVLEQYGYRVLEAEDAHKALMISEQHQGLIELMVTDVVMPEMSGKELAERLKVLRPEMKVLYMSGYTDNAVVRRGVISKDVDFLEKPFTPDVLAEKVRQVLDETERRQSR